MGISKEFLKKTEEVAMARTTLPTIALVSESGLNNIPTAFRDSFNDQYIGYEKILECEELGNFLVVDFKNNKVNVYSLAEKEKMLKDYNNQIVICDWNTPLHVYNVI